MARLFRKVLGAISVWKYQLTLPPFVANRIIRGCHLCRDEATGTYRDVGEAPDVHHRGASAENLKRRVQTIVPASALFWFSGNTAATGRGSLMGYLPVPQQEHWPWYISFVRNADGWKINRASGISQREIRFFEEAIV